MSGGVPAGWYPDPAAPDTQRYWDGEQWLGTPVPVDAAVPATPPTASAPLGDSGVGTGQEPARLPFPAAFQPTPTDADARHGEGAAPPNGEGTAPPHGLPPTQPPAGAPPHPPFGGDSPQGSGTPYGPGSPPGSGAPAQRPRGFGDSVWDAGQLPELAMLAPLPMRLFARLIDIVAVGLLTVAVNGYFFVQYYQEMSPQLDAYIRASLAGQPTPEIAPSAEATRLALIMTLTAIALWFAYEVPATANSGQTLGKRLVGIRVARLGGAPMTFWYSTRRWLVLGIPALLLQACGLPLQLIDCLWCTWDRPLQQCLHDKGVQTVVLMAAPRQAPQPPGGPHRTTDGSPDEWRRP